VRALMKDQGKGNGTGSALQRVSEDEGDPCLSSGVWSESCSEEEEEEEEGEKKKEGSEEKRVVTIMTSSYLCPPS
jgi:hypothetical protein